MAAVAALMIVNVPGPLAAQGASDEVDRVEDAIEILRDLTDQPDEGIPQYLLERAEAIVVIPDMIRGGFIVGAKHGRGVASVRDRATGAWSPPAFVAMTGGSVGWQIGAQSVDLVLLVMNQNGVRRLMDNRFTLGGELSVAAGPVGRTANAATDIGLDSQILAYSRAKGLFAGATLEGVSLRADDGANERFYGRELELREIALERAPNSRAPIIVSQWSDTLRVLSASARPDRGASAWGARRPGTRPSDWSDAETANLLTIVDRPDRYYGRRITISAPVEDVYSRTIFSVDDDPGRSTGREIVIINPTPADRIDDEGTVTIVGTLYEFNRGDLERRLGNWRWDVSSDVLRSFDERPVLVAESIRITDRELVSSGAGRGWGGEPNRPFATPPVTFDGTLATVDQIVAKPKDFYKKQVMVTAEVEDVYSRSVFSIDEDKLLSTGRDVLVVAPTIRRPVADDLDVTIVGEVMRFRKGDVEDRFRDYELDLRDELVRMFKDRPVIIATSIRTRDGEELLGARVIR
jgi:lipid-binding SYLF domain-containing protein